MPPRVAVVEIGAGKAVPTVRYTSEGLMRSLNAGFVRINPREHDGPDRTVPLATGGLTALTAIDEAIEALRAYRR